jgi:hypothetical protein
MDATLVFFTQQLIAAVQFTSYCAMPILIVFLQSDSVCPMNCSSLIAIPIRIRVSFSLVSLLPMLVISYEFAGRIGAAAIEGFIA